MSRSKKSGSKSAHFKKGVAGLRLFEKVSAAPDRRRTRGVILLLLVLLYLLHNDFWNWGQPEFLFSIPSGLLYHLGLCLAATLIYWLLTLVAWPQHLDSVSRDEDR